MPKKLEVWTVWDFSLLLSQNIKKLQSGPFEIISKISKKSLTMPKKLKGGSFGLVRYCILREKHFWFSSLGQHPFCRKTSKKIEGRPHWGTFFFRKKSHCLKKTFSLARYCMLRWKKETRFWFSYLGQIVQFDTIKLRKTFVELFLSFRVD